MKRLKYKNVETPRKGGNVTRNIDWIEWMKENIMGRYL